MNHVERAVQLHKKGYNCAQSVVCAFADVCGLSEAELFRIAEGFGGGMGGLQQTCGAVTGAYMVLGLLGSNGDPDSPRESTGKTYRSVRALEEAFRLKNQSTICSALRGTAGQPKLRSCDGCVEDAATLVEEYLAQKSAD